MASALPSPMPVVFSLPRKRKASDGSIRAAPFTAA